MFKLRDGLKEDCMAIEAMIKELAKYLKINTPLDRHILERDAFGQQRPIKIIVAELEDSKQLIGCALYYFKYSTHQGKILHLEDMYVKSEYRHLGVGQTMLTEVTKHAYDNCCGYVEWTCLNWNHNSIRFYEKFGAKQVIKNKEILKFGLNGQQIQQIVDEINNNK